MVQDPTYGFNEGLRAQLANAGFSLNALPWEGPRPQEVRGDDAQARIYEAMAQLQGILDTMPPGTSQHSALVGQREELTALMRDAVAGRAVEPSRLERVLANVQSAVSVAETTGTQQASVRFALQGERYSREAMAAMHYEYYANDAVYRMQVDAITERAEARIVESDRRREGYERLLSDMGIETPHDEEVERLRRERDRARAAGDPYEARRADAAYAGAAVDQADAAVAQATADGRSPEEIAALQAEADARRTEFDQAMVDYDAQVAALRAAEERRLTREGVDIEARERQLAAFDAERADDRSALVERGDVAVVQRAIGVDASSLAPTNDGQEFVEESAASLPESEAEITIAASEGEVQPPTEQPAQPFSSVGLNLDSIRNQYAGSMLPTSPEDVDAGEELTPMQTASVAPIQPSPSRAS